ncbi:unnamed protein product [Rotaria sordida]|uniref:Uncharacterized protein n=1 Tax=Rotaria sordida TaxID=392033 RepID=A0A814E311_9BILA|nr:unnamed protein product [Rotaria sordida]CAF1574502.1 unnamed protein product [Rotaria sordida]
MIRLSSLLNLNRLFQLSSILIFKQLFTSEASTITTDKQGKILINLAGDVMIERAPQFSERVRKRKETC